MSQDRAKLERSPGGVGGFRWELQKAGLTLDVQPHVLRRIADDYAARGNAAWGLLLGTPPAAMGGRRHVEVRDCIELDGTPGEFAADTRMVAHTFARSHASTAVGIYLRPGSNDARTVGDLILAAVGNLKAPLALVMAVRPESDGTLFADLNLRIAGDSLQNIHKTTTPLLGPAAEAVAYEPAEKTTIPWRLPAIAAVALAGIIGLGIWLRSGDSTATPTAPTRDLSHAPPPAASGLDVSATRSGNDLVVTWNAASPVLRGAGGGVLLVTDGQKRTEVLLDEKHLQSGRVLYVPRTNDLDVRLEIITGRGQRVSESLRVLGAGREPDKRLSRGQSYPAGSARVEGNRSAEMLRTGPAVERPRDRAPVPPPPVTTTEAAPAPGVAGFVPAQPVEKVAVSVPAQLRSALQGEVTAEVRVRVDETGRVIAAETAVTDPSPLTKEFAEVARNTALKWRFTPAQQNEKPVPSDYTIVFRFHK
jgi:hypothetical protein